LFRFRASEKTDVHEFYDYLQQTIPDEKARNQEVMWAIDTIHVCFGTLLQEKVMSSPLFMHDTQINLCFELFASSPESNKMHLLITFRAMPCLRTDVRASR
jgi:hypothetical protein